MDELVAYQSYELNMEHTAPFGDQRIDIHQKGQQLMGLVETGLISVKRNQNGALIF
jgi:hypothetical protein